LLDNVVP